MNVTEQQIEEMESLAESYDRVKIGNKAPLIEGKTIYDDYFNINEIDTDFVVVLFWSYSCEHCRSIMRDMKKFLREHPDYALVALSVKGDIKKIRRLIAKNDLEGFFYHDGLDWEGKFVSAYAIDATPSMFVLDKNRIIVAKPFDMEELIEFTNN